MTLAEVMTELESKGSAATKRIWMTHGAPEPVFGVKVADLKVLAKKIARDQKLALELFATGNADAMYLAGIVADGKRMTSEEVNRWAETASWSMISEYSVPWVASEHSEGRSLALKWIDSAKESVASSGWSTLAALAAILPDDQLPLQDYSALLDRVEKTLKAAPDRVRYTMNGFVICCGTYITTLADKAIATARALGPVKVDMGGTACKVPEAESYIIKCRRGAPVAKKRKTVRC